MKCECKQFTIKVTQGNAWQLLLPLRTAHWEQDKQIVENVDVDALQDIVVYVDGEEWQDWAMDERGPLLTIPSDMPFGAHNVEMTATYFGVEIRAAYFECFTIVRWSYESNTGQFIPDAPITGEAAYVYIGITDDEEIDALKAELRQKIAEANAAKARYEAMVEEYAEKIEELDDLATKTDVTTAQESIEGTVGTATATTTQNIATNEAHTAQNITAAKNEILAALPQEAPASFIQSLFAHES
jgi:hypothetical protein